MSPYRSGVCGDKTAIRGRRYVVSRDDGTSLVLGRIGEVDEAVPRRHRAGFLELV